jgi:hypothetical protein
MADLSITASSVIADSSARMATGTAGETVTAGKMVYYDTATRTYKLADNNSGTAAVRSPIGMALHAASTGQPLTIAKGGDITLGAVLTAGISYYLSDTPGGICPVADLTTGEYPVLVGMARSTSVLSLRIQEAGVALA